MDKFLGILIILLLFIIVLYIPHLREMYYHKKLHLFVLWCISQNRSKYSDATELYMHIHNANLRIPDEYKLDEEDFDSIKNILKAYKEDLNLNYINGNLGIDKWVYEFSYQEYFFFTLHTFLEKHAKHTDFINEELYVIANREETKDGYISITYKLTDFATIYYKLYLISELECENNKRINKFNYYRDSESIKNTIETKLINRDNL